MYNNTFTIKATKGKFNFLDRSYQNLILENTKLDENMERWEIYSIIIDELIILGGALEFQKIKYRLTGGEDPNLIMLDIIKTYSANSVLLQTMKSQVEIYVDEDWSKQFDY